MPIYPAIKTYWGGFYNNKKTNGVDDRVYTAEDIRKPYDVIYSDGVKPDADGTAGESLKVSVTGEMSITVGRGHAKLGGAWFTNGNLYTIVLDTATSEDRYDCVIVRNDDSDDVRAPQIYIKSLATVPTSADLTRTDKIYEICLAYVRVPAFATEITEDNLVDTREDGELSNTMSGVGATVIRTFRGTYFSKTVGQTVIPIAVPFVKSRDNLTVIVEGRIFAQGENYTIEDDNNITLAVGLPVVGTRIDFVNQRNVNAAGAETVVKEVADLIDEMAVVNNKLQYDYVCNGVNDNVNISNIVKAYLQDGTDYGTMHLNVIGHLGMTRHIKGSGTSASPYVWFDLDATGTRRVILDFSRCTQIAPDVEGGAYSVIFHSENGMIIKGANVVVSKTETNTIVRITNALTGAIDFEDCRFWITAYKDSMIAMRGTFKNCRGSIANVVSNSYCFLPNTNSIVRVIGGEYYAYTGEASAKSAVVGQSGADAVSILYGVNAPTVARAGFYQTNSLIQFVGGGILNCTDLISALEVTVTAGISNIRGTIAKSKPGAM